MTVRLIVTNLLGLAATDTVGEGLVAPRQALFLTSMIRGLNFAIDTQTVVKTSVPFVPAEVFRVAPVQAGEEEAIAPLAAILLA